MMGMTKTEKGFPALLLSGILFFSSPLFGNNSNPSDNIKDLRQLIEQKGDFNTSEKDKLFSLLNQAHNRGISLDRITIRVKEGIVKGVSSQRIIEVAEREIERLDTIAKITGEIPLSQEYLRSDNHLSLLLNDFLVLGIGEKKLLQLLKLAAANKVEYDNFYRTGELMVYLAGKEKFPVDIVNELGLVILKRNLSKREIKKILVIITESKNIHIPLGEIVSLITIELEQGSSLRFIHNEAKNLGQLRFSPDTP